MIKRLVLVGAAIALVVKFTKRGQAARNVYIDEVSSGSKPLEAVATAVAAFVDPPPPPPPPLPPRPR